MKKILLYVILVISFTAAQQAGKVYVLSEGGFSAGSSKLSMLDNHNGVFTSNIFTPGNLGLYPDGLIYHDNHLYLLEQGSFGGSGKIYKIDTNGTVINSKVTGVNPYSLAVSNGKIFITNGPAGNVTVLKAADFTDAATIAVGVYPQEIFAAGGKVYVANTSLFGGAEDNTVSVIDAATNTQVTKITVRKDPSSLAISPDGYLLVACPGDAVNGAIYKIDTATYAKTDSFFISVEGVGKELAVDKTTGTFYFISNNGNIVRYDMANRQSSVVITAVPGTNYFYGYNFDYLAKKHYVLDAKTFTVTGSMYVYSDAGTLLNTYETGTAPRRIVFKYETGTTVVDEEYTADQGITLVNYPNPFSERTNILVKVARGEWRGASWEKELKMVQLMNVTVRIFNVMGELIYTIIDKPLDDGSYVEEFESKNLPAGIYFCELVARGQRRVVKLVVRK
ncbi:MAG: hypothetical protein HUU54_09890 [Ignavibacteriaceae bacterium]|nr:hypothetical protein [Ignavibacteriaceae bacterium]